MIKLKIYKHSSLKTPIDDDIKKIPLYFSSDFVRQYINEEIIYDVENTSLDYKDDNLFKPNEKNYDVVMLVYEAGTFPIYGKTEYYSPSLKRCYASVSPMEDSIDYSWKMFVHEILHAIWFIIMMKNGKYIPNLLDSYYLNDQPYAPNGNFAKQLEVLKPFYPRWNYFKDSEVVGLKTELVDMLDKARGLAGIPFAITSGYRTTTHNEDIGGVKDSSHTKGEAVDLRARNSHEHYLITKALFAVGFKRISRGYPSHIHCDISEDKAQEVLF